MLYRPEDFEPLVDEPWDEARIRDGIRDIVADTDAAYRGRKLLWRADEWDRWRATSPLKTLYCGAAGIVWALDELRRRGHAETQLDLTEVALQTLELERARPDYGTKALSTLAIPEPRESSLLCGEAGVLLVACGLAPSAELADALFGLVLTNVDNEAEELMWGSPGAMLIAARMLEWTGGERWRRAWGECSDALLARREEDGLWTQRMFGQSVRFLGPVHGYVGNVQVLAALAGASGRRELERSANEVLARTAVFEDGLANWPPIDRPQLERGRRDPPAVVPRSAGRRHRGGVLPRRRALPRGRRAHLARRRPPGRARLLDLPRDGRQRLRAVEGVRAHG